MQSWEEISKEFKELMLRDRKPEPLIFISGIEGCKMMEDAFKKEGDRLGIKIKEE